MKPEQQKCPIMDMRNFQTTTKHPFRKLPLRKEILKDLASLNPLLQKAERWVRATVRTARRMAQVISQKEISLWTDKWVLYQAQGTPESWYREAGSDECLRIDLSWKTVLEQ